MAEVGDDPNGRLLTILQEVESLKRLLEEEQQNHASQVQLLQDKLEEKESNVEFEIVEEKLKLAESELELVLQRAEKAEKSMEDLEDVVQCLKQKIGELEEKVSKSAFSPPLPPPLPPPPPPLPPAISMTGQSSIKLLVKERLITDCTAVSDMENMLGITPKKTPAVAQQPGNYVFRELFRTCNVRLRFNKDRASPYTYLIFSAINDIINQIKGGRFTLKHTDVSIRKLHTINIQIYKDMLDTFRHIKKSLHFLNVKIFCTSFGYLCFVEY